MSKNLLYGSYGNFNVGEEAVLMAILNKKGRDNTTVTSANPQETMSTHRVKATGEKRYELYDKIIVGGCGIFYGETAKPYAEAILHSKKLGKETEILNVGVGPLWGENTVNLVCESFSVADKVSVRTNFAKIILEKIGVNRNIPVERDISCDLDVPDCSKLIESLYGPPPYIGISVKNHDIYWKNLVSKIKEYITMGYTVVPIFNAWSQWSDERKDALGFRKMERIIRKNFNRWGCSLLPPLITMGVIKCMDVIISQTVHTNVWADHFGVYSFALVPENNFHPMAFKQLGAKDVIFSTPPNHVDTSGCFMEWNGIKWDEIG